MAAASAPLVTASRPSPAGPYTPGSTPAAGPPGGASGEMERFEAEFADGFDETYRGCRIRGCRDTAGGARTAGAARTAPAGPWRVTVDDRPLHLMRRADGGYLTMIDHYQSYPTPLAAARAAVDELGGTLRLRATVTGAEPGEGHGHGVHT
ncbi:tyrosinase family oxidase copper chaperone [Streptomyces sp. NPDC006285]|uniref:tyrosinase family oxidase copper chaperone n=1 Tax=Streptomyces sp. NPDC006285 TaxID=3364742 RepID=UPI0036809B4E